jgi:hypothetical protein
VTFLAARSVTHEYTAGPTTAKVVATLNAVMVRKEMGFDNIPLEGDALQFTSYQSY